MEILISRKCAISEFNSPILRLTPFLLMNSPRTLFSYTLRDESDKVIEEDTRGAFFSSLSESKRCMAPLLVASRYRRRNTTGLSSPRSEDSKRCMAPLSLHDIEGGTPPEYLLFAQRI
jgi:hypothetical protein